MTLSRKAGQTDAWPSMLRETTALSGGSRKQIRSLIQGQMAASHASDILRCLVDVTERSGPTKTAPGTSEGAGDEGNGIASHKSITKDVGGEGRDDGMSGVEAGCGYDIVAV